MLQVTENKHRSASYTEYERGTGGRCAGLFAADSRVIGRLELSGTPGVARSRRRFTARYFVKPQSVRRNFSAEPARIYVAQKKRRRIWGAQRSFSADKSD